MGERIPTQPGDVLILSIDQSFTVYAMGLVTKDGQQEFDTHMKVKHDRARPAAVAGESLGRVWTTNFCSEHRHRRLVGDSRLTDYRGGTPAGRAVAVQRHLVQRGSRWVTIRILTGAATRLRRRLTVTFLG
jgi:hypothetical protein